MQRRPIVLDKALPKCVPGTKVCPRRDSCASYLVSGDGRGRRDYTTGSNYWKAESCEGFRDAAKCRGDGDGQPKGTLHDAPQGLR